MILKMIILKIIKTLEKDFNIFRMNRQSLSLNTSILTDFTMLMRKDQDLIDWAISEQMRKMG